MSIFVRRQENRVLDAYAALGLTPEKNQYPLLALVPAALRDGEGSLVPSPELQGPSENELALWESLASQSPEQFNQVVSTVVNRDRASLPTSSPKAVREWCAALVLAVSEFVKK